MSPNELGLSLDLEAAFSFLRAVLPPGLPVAAVGYSFGCALLPRLRRVEELDALVLIAPTVAKHDYESFRTVTRPMLVIAPEDDFATDAGELRRWFDQLSAPRQLVPTRLDNHFFRGHERWLVETVLEFLGPRWEEAANVGQ